jgi:tetratricopeptide (TPR) repeat protein
LLEGLAKDAPESDRATLLLERAEALEAAKDTDGAADLYRELLGGAFGVDASLGLRRVLPGGQDQKHGEGSVPDQWTVGRFGRLIKACRAGQFDDIVKTVEELGEHEFAAMRPTLLHLALLVDEGRGGGQSARLLGLALRAAGDQPSLPLLLRALVAELGQGQNGVKAADAMERFSRTIAKHPAADARAVAAMLVQAAAFRAALGDEVQAEALLREAIGHDAECLAALVWLRRLLVRRARWAEALPVCESEAHAWHGPQQKAAAYFLAARLAETKVSNPLHATALLRKVLEVDPAHRVAFESLRRLLEQQDQKRQVRDLIGVRLQSVQDPAERSSLQVDRAKFSVQLGARAQAEEELSALLGEQPENRDALWALAELKREGGDWKVASDLYIRQARLERDPERLRELFLHIGRIHREALPDMKLATGAFERVLRLEAQNTEALDALSQLYAAAGDTRRALAVTEPLVQRETDPRKRAPLLIRLSGLCEKAEDHGRAETYLKQAVSDSGGDLDALDALVTYYLRTQKTQERRELLDGALARLRRDLQEHPQDVARILRAVIPVLRWHQRNACATAAAQALLLLGDEPQDRKQFEELLRSPSRGRRLSALVNPELQDLSLPPSLPRGVRNVLRLCGPALAKASKPNLKRWGVGRGSRAQESDACRQVSSELAADLGIKGFEMYVAKDHPRALAVEPGDPAAIVLGSEFASDEPAVLRFACAYTLRLMATHLDLLVAGTAEQAGALLAGIVRQVMPGFKHPELFEGDVVAASHRVAKTLAKILSGGELGPLAAEIAVPFLVEKLYIGAHETAARAGLLSCGNLGVALKVLLQAQDRKPSVQALLGSPSAFALLDFALSENYEKLVAALDSVS